MHWFVLDCNVPEEALTRNRLSVVGVNSPEDLPIIELKVCVEQYSLS